MWIKTNSNDDEQRLKEQKGSLFLNLLDIQNEIKKRSLFLILLDIQNETKNMVRMIYMKYFMLIISGDERIEFNFTHGKNPTILLNYKILEKNLMNISIFCSLYFAHVCLFY